MTTCGGMLGCLVLAGTGLASAQSSVVAVPSLDLNRFTGTWYEVARLPAKSEKKCIGTPIALYALGDKPRRIQVVNSCPVKDGSTNLRNANGKTANKSGDGKLKVTYTWPFAQKQWVLATGTGYEWAVVGSPNHKSLWIFSRSVEMKPEAFAQAKSVAAGQGFHMEKLLVAQSSVSPR